MSLKKMEEKKKKRFIPAVNPALCKECGYCLEVCSQGVFAGSGSLNSSGYRYMTAKHGEKCSGCYKCIMICPDFAIALEQVEK